MSWGCDFATRSLIFNSLPEVDINFLEKESSVEHRNNFIEKSLMKAANALDKEGYNIEKICEFIVDNCNYLHEDSKLSSPEDK